MDAASNVTIGLAFLAGFLSFISPCVLPLIPAYVGYLSGRATTQISMELAAAGAGSPGSVALAQKNRLGTVLHGLFFVLGFTFVFVVFGLLTNASLQLLRARSYDFQVLIARVGGILVIFFGLHVMGVTSWVLRGLTNRVDWAAMGGAGHSIQSGLERIMAVLYGDTRRQMNPHSNSGYLGSALMGVIFAAGWTPCVGPIYGSILTLASANSTWGQAGVLLLSYSLGLGLPFLLTAAALDQTRGLLKRLQRRMRLIEIASGAFLLVIGYLLFTGQMASLAQVGGGSFADFTYNLEECVTGVVRGNVPAGDFGTCMNLGPNYKYLNQQSFVPAAGADVLAVLPDGRWLYAR
jgi:cytochrome c-type biogenesis protein